LAPARDATALDAPPDLLEMLPVAIYAGDAQGLVLWFNNRAVDIWGRTPQTGTDSEKFCGSYRLYFGGKQICREETPMAQVLRRGIPIRGVAGEVERPDGSRVWAICISSR
jgi:hypothetical protein